ncbi:hypothetical protein ACJVC5_07910 [Peredibacter sp. HCB2-198]|uniref:hypothetical protein n=1 Tax=Peredibacter sp. HCB2-198 TaxID=3383025 RepID=UPI0038B4A559
MNITKKILISFFILFNFFIMLRVHMPLENKVVSKVYEPIDSYLSFFSIYQSWTMFAPDPSRLNLFITAEVEFEDGSKDSYDFPRAKDLGMFENVAYGERYDKLMTSSLYRDDHDFLWKDTAKFVLRKLKAKNFHKIPMKVHLVKHWYLTPRLEKKFLPHLSNNQTYESFKFYTYEVL